MENNESYILSIDQGTTSTRVAIIDKALKIVAIEQSHHEQICPQPGWTEHDPLEIYHNVMLSIERLSHSHHHEFKRIKSVAITNQRETCLAWNKLTGDYYCNALVWHDMRTAKIVDNLITKYGKDAFVEVCGLPINTYFSAVKIRWMIENVSQVGDKVNKSEIDDLCFGTIDSWLIYVI
jgi:glycerol kinase